jgi:hypothetical protein
MAEPDKRPVTMEELLVSSLAQTDALPKFLIEKGLITRQEFMQKISEERATYQKSSTLRSNEHRRHFTLGSHQRSALDSRGVHRRSSKRSGNLLVRYMNALVFRP